MRRTIHLALVHYCLVAATCCIAGGSANWWNVGFLSWKASHRLDQTLILSAQPTCSSIAGLSPKQTQFCQQHFSLMPAVTHGARLGIQECLSQFRTRRWNCGAEHSAGLAFGPASDDATKESAFAHAISAAGVVHAVSRACKRAAQDGEASLAPLLRQCGCSKALRPGSLNRDWIWGGCGDDIRFGYQFAKGFIDVREAEQNYPRFSPVLAKTMVNLHNNEVGRRTVFKNAEVGCKCHGVSGSCSLRTCWQQLRAFDQVGEHLLGMYDRAALVELSKRGQALRRVTADGGSGLRRRVTAAGGSGLRKPRFREMVYMTASPDYCKPNPDLGIAGTQNRECDPEPASGPSSCKELCCGRGHVTKRVSKQSSCQCKFEWCCHVKCKTCEEEKEVHVCK